ncbi:MAG: GYD domain-containing protein [Gammaproteobacteria bacterium]|nr:GYD domain-containing protein [Gammaproteobacteria bacterium]
MATFITLGNFTEQGIRDVKQSTQRAKAFQEMAEKAGVTVKAIYWTVGAYDLVVIIDAPDGETATAQLLSVGAMGNVRTQTLRGFSAEEMDGILANMA